MNGGTRPPFTALQWQELEHQALIYKFMMAGVPVPPDLLLPIRISFESVAARFCNRPNMGYSFYGKKPDPEPGRCRRTDGKKWRCSKDAYLDSKYCERHMHRGRNRSRKPVETQTISQCSSSTATLLPSSCSSAGVELVGSLQNQPLHSIANSQGLSTGSINHLHLQIEPDTYEMGNKQYRHHHGYKEVDEHSFFAGSLESSRGLGMDFPVDTTWRLMPSASSFPQPKPILKTNCPQL